jgi:hypothetical protein
VTTGCVRRQRYVDREVQARAHVGKRS